MKFWKIIDKGYISILKLSQETWISRPALERYRKWETIPNNERAIKIYEVLLDVKTLKTPDITELF